MRKTVSSWNLVNHVEVHETLLDPFFEALDEDIRVVGLSVKFALTNRLKQFRTRIAGDKSWIFKTENPGKHAVSDVNRVSHRMRSKPDTGGTEQLFQGVEAGFFPGKQDVVRLTAVRAKISKFVDVLTNTGLSQNCARYKRAPRTADSETLGAGEPIKIIGCLSATSTVHIFINDQRVAWYVFLQEWDGRFDAQISSATSRASLNNPDGLSLVKGTLAKAIIG